MQKDYLFPTKLNALCCLCGSSETVKTRVIARQLDVLQIVSNFDILLFMASILYTQKRRSEIRTGIVFESTATGYCIYI